MAVQPQELVHALPVSCLSKASNTTAPTGLALTARHDQI